MMGNPLSYVEIPDSEIMDIMQTAGRSLDGRPENAVFLGLISLAIFMRNPSMDGEQLREGVRSTSEFIAMYTDTLTDGKKAN